MRTVFFITIFRSISGFALSSIHHKNKFRSKLPSPLCNTTGTIITNHHAKRINSNNYSIIGFYHKSIIQIIHIPKYVYILISKLFFFFAQPKCSLSTHRPIIWQAGTKTTSHAFPGQMASYQTEPQLKNETIQYDSSNLNHIRQNSKLDWSLKYILFSTSLLRNENCMTCRKAQPSWDLLGFHWKEALNWERNGPYDPVSGAGCCGLLSLSWEKISGGRIGIFHSQVVGSMATHLFCRNITTVAIPPLHSRVMKNILHHRKQNRRISLSSAEVQWKTRLVFMVCMLTWAAHVLVQVWTHNHDSVYSSPIQTEFKKCE